MCPDRLQCNCQNKHACCNPCVPVLGQLRHHVLFWGQDNEGPYTMPCEGHGRT